MPKLYTSTFLAYSSLNCNHLWVHVQIHAISGPITANNSYTYHLLSAVAAGLHNGCMLAQQESFEGFKKHMEVPLTIYAWNSFILEGWFLIYFAVFFLLISRSATYLRML